MLEPIVSGSNLVPEAAKNKIINVSYQSTNITHHKKRQSETLNRQMPIVNQHLNWYFHLLEYGFLELIINGANVQFGLKDHGLVYVWDIYTVWNQPKTTWHFTLVPVSVLHYKRM
jgi:hypothetical protein